MAKTRRRLSGRRGIGSKVRPRFVDIKRAAGRRERPLRATLAFADLATHANRRRQGGIDLDALGVDDALRVKNVAAKRDRKGFGWRPVSAPAVRNGSGDPQVGLLIGHPRQLHQDFSRISKSLINIPEWTGPPDGGKMEICRRLALRYVSGAIDT